ncbi:MAG TPA: hypothetical protein PLD20_09505 [Blastocatellia bacterium]|nr:hypothetical protein [Blastocatellia bacterium]HMZ18154.1 hypothetical protein [Blastocatellia bacterium]HNG32678.1 hypothetical protein [Blastocatellia bacterium]
MANSLFDQLREAAKRTAQDLDNKFELKNKFEQGATLANEAARKAGETVNQAATAARQQFEKFDQEHNVTDNLRDVAGKAEEAFNQGKQAAQAAQSGVEQASKVAEETAREVFGSAQTYYKRAEQAYNTGTAGARMADATLSGYQKARIWVKENPGKTAVVTFSMIAGTRLGSALPEIGATILGAGASGHWFFHSALPIVGIRKLTEKYNDYLKDQEKLLAEGKLDEAERSRVEFQRNLTKYVGAPLLGAFSMAAGASMIGAAFSGATVTGFPISLILGGNPLLNGIWFFANGVVCISEGYKFFMIALADQEEVERVVREIKGLLPA